MIRPAEVIELISRLARTKERISDLVFTPGRPLQVAADGRLTPVKVSSFPLQELTPFQTEVLALALIGKQKRLLKDLLLTGSADFSYHLPDGTRFRVNVFSSQGAYSIVMRKLASSPPRIKDLGLPTACYKIAKEKAGIVLVTGATGQGKTTTLAAILEEINHTEPVHIITLEDPVEYVHTAAKATFNQRELGRDFDTFASGLRAALRQAPHVILVGEIRDRETMEVALSAAETGHLVFSTMHTIGAGNTINRILGFFNIDEERQIRMRLADTIRWIVGQKLIPKKQGGRVAIFDILYNNIRVKETIIHGEDENRTFYDIMSKGSPYSMQTFDQHLLYLYEKDIIDEEVALAYCHRRDVVGRGIDLIKTKRGERTSDLEETLTVEIESRRKW
ncbi:type IV pilus twitching motility protein PilT [Thermodesulfatator atlanticus]|uniref:type IV pilus twitching motility protein PilT n=1 Tax=Thermodesulfatator atlanticus TaxID=501497 RepID=UPI0003B3C1E4|nr:PilT/PilU family type 4a pilus ATPase [Thermodesulfatator atlanticus]